MRAAGYYCSNNVKEDYNVAPVGRVWDESSNKAHWRKRAAGQPFFAVFNHTITHESQIRNAIDPADRIHDPAPDHHPGLSPRHPRGPQGLGPVLRPPHHDGPAGRSASCAIWKRMASPTTRSCSLLRPRLRNAAL
ncbi:MAG: hypothetical protein U0992_15150 [Planctomycetaceae bacterium]